MTQAEQTPQQVRDAAYAEIKKRMDRWFAVQDDILAANPDDYAGCTVDDWVCWFTETGMDMCDDPS